MAEKSVTIIKNSQFIAAVAAVLFAAAIALAVKQQEKNEEILQGRELTCVIDIGRNMFGRNAMLAGLSYEMLEKFGEVEDCSMRIVAYGRNASSIDSLLCGAADIVVEACGDSLCIGNEGVAVIYSSGYEGVRWTMRAEDRKEMKRVNLWLENYMGSEEYAAQLQRFGKIRDPRKSRSPLAEGGTLGPYDDVIRQYADSIGWDWRMLAAIVYQESRFALNTRSHRGAVGLMQIKPSTADSYNISDLLDPQKNISAGTKHLKRLDRMFGHYGLSREERMKVVLAAYNAGEGRISECIHYAGVLGYDSTSWEGISSMIPQIGSDSVSVDDSSLLSHFKGEETIAYVDSVLEIYNSICRLVR